MVIKMRGANRVIKYVCSECFKEFSPNHKEAGIAHTTFSHTHNVWLKEVKDES